MDQLQPAIDAALAALDELDAAGLLAAMVDIPSPTGQERRLAEFLARHLSDAGLEGRLQPIDAQQANAVGRLRGAGDGPDLLLYAPIDTGFSGDPAEDCPWIGAAPPADLLPAARVDGDDLRGLGAENPKGYAAAVVLAAEAVARSGVRLRGDLLAGLGAGGMPTNRRPVAAVERHNTGQGSGCAFLLEQGVRGDFAVICKPGWSVAWEEVGLCWFRVDVRGELNYTGIRHLIPYRNPILHAAQVIAELEAWFPHYTERHRSGLVAPQGSVGAVEGGWPHKPAFVPACCRFYVDLRVSPRSDPMAVKHEFGAALAAILTRHPEIELDWEMVLSIPGSHTPPDNWIVRCCTQAWESVAASAHTPPAATSGATDANVLRAWGVPTARIGMPRRRGGGFTMDVASIAGVRQLARCLVVAALQTCSRPRAEVGLP